jgi:hypothetical protein
MDIARCGESLSRIATQGAVKGVCHFGVSVFAQGCFSVVAASGGGEIFSFKTGDIGIVHLDELEVLKEFACVDESIVVSCIESIVSKFVLSCKHFKKNVCVTDRGEWRFTSFSKILIRVIRQSHGIDLDIHVLSFLVFQLFPHFVNVNLLLGLGTILTKMSFVATIDASSVLDAIDVHGCTVSFGHGFLFGHSGSNIVFGLGRRLRRSHSVCGGGWRGLTISSVSLNLIKLLLKLSDWCQSCRRFGEHRA